MAARIQLVTVRRPRARMAPRNRRASRGAERRSSGPAIRAYFLDHLERDLEDLQYRCDETRDEGHGRIDERSYLLTKTPRDFAPAKDWPWVKAIGYSVRVTRHADGTESDEVRYYLRASGH